MNYQVNTRYMQDAIEVLAGIIQNKAPFTDIQITADAQGKVKFTAINSEMDVCYQVPASVFEAGTLTVPGQALVLIVRSLPGQVTYFQAKAGVVRLKSQETFCELQATQEALPEVTFLQAEAGTELSMALLKKSINRTRYASSKESSNKALEGIRLECKGGKLRVVSCDGFRMAMDENPCEALLPEQLLITQKAGEKLVGLVKDDTVQVQVTNSCLQLAGKHIQLNVRLLDHPYPDYESVIPRSFIEEITVEAEKLAEVVQRVSVLSTVKDVHRIDTELKGNTLTFRCVTPFGRNEESIEVKRKHQEVLHWSLNGRFLSEGLRVITGSAHLSISGAHSPMVIRSGSGDYQCIITPLKTT